MNKAQDYLVFRRLVSAALRSIEPSVFLLPVAGAGEIVRERNFCYSFYHHLRNAIDRAAFEYQLGGELDKRGHPVIKNRANPDLVAHIPGTMDWNLCVMEVKPINGARDGFVKDVRNLLGFVGECEYHAGVLVVFGETEHAEDKIRELVGGDVTALRRGGVDVIWIPRAGAPIITLE